MRQEEKINPLIIPILCQVYEVASARAVVEEYFRAIQEKDDEAILKTLTTKYNHTNTRLSYHHLSFLPPNIILTAYQLNNEDEIDEYFG